uniref:C2 domain-containing protein n=1 Tax=Guillardia theta TaxID=55529 RepID=A0A7S4U961_GUITH|mmetsp:Transcript_8036/g.26900  ORF Transcript_8036/g.26900 Transcript_8036/m.26900 type:complete len:592 (+) Transcript_8036:177-1952(+)
MVWHGVYSCGHGAGGRLGLNDERARTAFTGPLGTLQDVEVKSLACGGKHNLLLSRAGKVYSWGYNDSRQTGHGVEDLSDWEPRWIRALETVKVVQIAAGEDHSVALTDRSEVFTWGRGLHGQLGHGDVSDVWFPFLVKGLQGKGIKSIGCGYENTFAITGTGKVLGFGSAASGKLGNGDVDGGIGGNVYLPVQLKSLAKFTIIQATGGKNFSMFLSHTGQLYSVGYAANGQLGIPFEEVESLNLPYTGTMQEVSHKGVFVKYVSCGDSHSLALSEDGIVYSWGSGINWALGHGGTEDTFTPKMVAMLEADPCVSVSAGGYHSAAVSATGRIYTWGRNFVGQLGTGQNIDDHSADHVQRLPTRVILKGSVDSSEMAMRVGCGQCHTILQTALKGDEPEQKKEAAKQAEPMKVEEKHKKEEEIAPPVVAPTEEKEPEKVQVKKQFLDLEVEVVSGHRLLASDKRGTSDPYCKISIKEGRVKQKFKTKAISKTLNPHWNEKFLFKGCCNRIAIEGDPRMGEEGRMKNLNWDLKLKLSCLDQDSMGEDESLGVLFVPLAGLRINKKRDIKVPLAPKLEGQVVSGEIRLRLLLKDE